MKNKQKIFNFGKSSIFIGKLYFLKFCYFPKFSYLDGGSYFKIGIRWMKYVIEFSRPKKNNRVYIKTTSEELDKILKRDII